MPEPVLHNDKELFSHIADGDEKAFETLYRRYVPQLLPFVTNTVRTNAVADEVIQETFLRLWMGRDKLPEVNEPRAWIFRIAANICYTHLKRSIRERQAVNLLVTEQGEEDDHTQTSELAHLILHAIDKMPAQRKKIYRLSREGGMTIPQIAEALGISPNTVKNTLGTALQSIRDFLKEKGYDIPLVIIGLLYF